MMDIQSQILQLAKENNGIITTSQLTEAGFSREYLRILTEKGKLERIARAIYATPAALPDEMYNLQLRYKKGIFSHGTALYLHNLTDRTPIQYTMTFPQSYKTTSVQENNVICFRVKKELYLIGSIETMSPGGHLIRTYDAERTICDVLRGHSDADIRLITDALKNYVKFENKDIPKLSAFAKMFRVEKKLRSYLEVLL